LTKENEDLREKLSKWEIKFSMAMKANDEALRTSQEKAHLAQLQVASSQQESSSDLAALQDELDTERQAKLELEMRNRDLLRQLNEAEEALKNQQGNPLLLPAADSGSDSSFFMTGSQSTPRLVEAVGLAQPPAQGSHFEEFIKLKKENKTLRAELSAVKKARGPLTAVVVPKAR
jgi:DNA repair exonuclease SbcCD ATPase subunit